MRSSAQAPRLSVVVNNYNYARFLVEALDSVIPQLLPADELIVVDDGSTDESPDILARYAQTPRVKVLFQHNQRQLNAMLNGMAAAQGDLCLMLDSDDYYLPGYLQSIRTLATIYPEVGMFFSAPEVDGDAEQQVQSIKTALQRMELEEGVTGLSRWSVVYGGEFLATPCSGLVLRRNLADQLLAIRDKLPDHQPISPGVARLLGIPEKAHTASHISADSLIAQASSIAGYQKYYLRTPSFYYRIHGGNAYASIPRIGAFYLQRVRNRQIVQMATRALDVGRPQSVAEVLNEARQRSRPLRMRRRLHLALNYLRAVYGAQDSFGNKMIGLWQVSRALIA